MHVSNRKTIRRLSLASFKAAKIRNIITVAAIALTTILFTVILTVGMSIKHGFEQSNFRQAGSYAHGEIKDITAEQFEELKDDPLIQEYGKRIFCGMPEKEPFHKSHVEVSYCDENTAKWMFLEPVEGRFPREGTNEAATDLKVLALLGVEPVIGNEFTMTFLVDDEETTETFTLCGYWDYDDAIVANHVLVPESRTREIFEKLGTQGKDGMTGLIRMGVMFKNASHIEENLNTILERHGYQSEGWDQGDNYIRAGGNWGYVSAQFEDSIDISTVLALIAVMLLIVFTGYLIIYNIFQISVAGDIHFYGLLKTIGTTPRQIKRIIRYQALVLCIVGIPVGILLGYGLSVGLMPIVLRGSTINRESMTISSSPIIFIGSALFALLTVLISCARPGRIASRVSPVEAVKYTDVNHIKKRERAVRGVKVYQMAFANLGRSKRKTVLVIVSLALAVTLLNELYAFVAGFDEDKYMSSNTCADFIVSSTDYFRYHRSDTYISESTIREIKANTDAALGGCGYIRTNGAAYMGMEEEVIRRRYKEHLEDAYVDIEIDSMEKKDGLLLGRVDIEGLDSALFDKLSVVEGDLSMMFDQDSHAVAVRVKEDAYGNIENRADYPKIGDKLTIEYTTGVKDTNSLEINHEIESYEVEYTVCALVFMPNTMSFRTQAIEGEYLIMPVERLRADGGQHVIPMFYLFDAADDNAEKAAENYLSQQTDQGLSTLMYESKATIQEEFRQFQRMFILLGSLLCVIVGMVGILNFFNAIMTGLLSRRKEFAVLQSIGMTNRQLRRMLIYEGMFYALGAIAVALAFALGIGPLIGHSMNKIFFFYQYQFSIMPVLAVVPSFVLLGCLIPAVLYGQSSRQSIVERLRDYF